MLASFVQTLERMNNFNKIKFSNITKLFIGYQDRAAPILSTFGPGPDIPDISTSPPHWGRLQRCSPPPSAPPESWARPSWSLPRSQYSQEASSGLWAGPGDRRVACFPHFPSQASFFHLLWIVNLDWTRFLESVNHTAHTWRSWWREASLRTFRYHSPLQNADKPCGDLLTHTTISQSWQNCPLRTWT